MGLKLHGKIQTDFFYTLSLIRIGYRNENIVKCYDNDFN